MHAVPVPKRLALALLCCGTALVLGAAPASATICPTPYVPGGIDAPVGGMYCALAGHHDYRDITRAMVPTLYFRLGDVAGSTVMGGDNGLPSGEYKNHTDSTPIGIADDGDAARDFYGSGGYGYITGIDAPNFHGETPYGNYTMEAWFQLAPGVHGGGILEFGRAGAVYVSSDTVYFRNGDDVSGGIPLANANKWYFVVAMKCGQTLTLRVQESSPSPFVWYSPDVATGTSTYRPEGQPTLYVGLNNLTGAPWFRGSMDEAAYFSHCVSFTNLFLQYESDPTPDPRTMTHTGYTGAPPSSPVGSAAATKPAVKPGPLTKTQRIKMLKRQIKSLSYDVRLARIAYSQLVIKQASPKKLRAARKAIAVLTKHLAQAKKQLKKLQAPPHKAKSRPKHRPAAKRHRQHTVPR